MADKPLVDTEFLLERFPGKGGWTYARIPQILQDKNAPFGWVKVKGTIDGFEISNYNLMPFGNGQLFLPVKAEIRKKIKKEEGDYVRVILYKDDAPYTLPQELITVLVEENAYALFLKHKKWEQKMCSEWIFSAKREETKKERIIKTIYRLKRGEKIV
jgi:hypothetical protein